MTGVSVGLTVTRDEYPPFAPFELLADFDFEPFDLLLLENNFVLLAAFELFVDFDFDPLELSEDSPLLELF